MSANAGSPVDSIDRRVLESVQAALSEIRVPEKTDSAMPKYEVRRYDNIGMLIVSVPGGSAIASLRYSNGRGSVGAIAGAHFEEFLADLSVVLAQEGKTLHIPNSANSRESSFGTGDSIYEALAGIPLGVGYHPRL